MTILNTPSVGFAHGSVVHLKRRSGKVDSYVFDRNFRNLATGERTQAAKDLGDYLLSDIISPDDDPPRNAREAEFESELGRLGVGNPEEATDDVVHQADLVAQSVYPYPDHGFD